MQKISKHELLDEISLSHKEPVELWKQKIGDIEQFLVLDYSETSISDYFKEFSEMGNLKKFRNLEEREQELADLKKSKKLYFEVEKYEHGSVHFSVKDTHDYPDKRWDVNFLQYIFIPCDFLQQQYKKESKSIESLNSIKTDSNAILQEYSDWCNGNVFAVHQYTVKNGKIISDDSVHELIGDKFANDTLKEMAISFKVAKHIQTERLKVNDFELKTPEDFKNHQLNIVQDNLQSAKLYEYENLRVLTLLYAKEGQKIPLVIEMNKMAKNEFDSLDVKKTKGITNHYKNGYHVKTIKQSKLQGHFYQPENYLNVFAHNIIRTKMESSADLSLEAQADTTHVSKVKMN